MAKRPKRPGNGASKPQVTPASGISVGSFTAVLIGTISFVLLFGWDGLLPLFTVPLAVGVLLGLISTSRPEALLVGASSGLLGSVLACLFYRLDAFIGYLNRTTPAAMADITGSLWQGFVLPLLAANPVNDPSVGPVVVIIVGTVLTAAFSFGAWWAAGRLPSIADRRWLGLAVIVPLGVCLAFTMFVSGKDFITGISTEPPAETYAYDGVVNLKTYYLIRGGLNYYDAIIAAAEGDTRMGEMKDGKWNGEWGINSPSRVRQPAPFYLWAIVGYFGASGIMWASLLLAVGLWVVWYWTLYQTLGHRALFVVPALFPLFVVHMAWFNLFMPNWWAALMLMYSAVFLVRKQYIWSAGFALVMVLFRETFVVYLIVVLGAAALLWLRKKLAGRDVVPFGITLGAFVAAYAAHYVTEAPYLGDVAVKEGTLSYAKALAARPFELRFFGATSYLMFPYGDAVLPAFVLTLAGAMGLAVVLRESDLARLALPAYLLVFLAILAIIGASSSYWGQDFSMLAVTGCAVLLAGLDRLGKRSSGAAVR